MNNYQSQIEIIRLLKSQLISYQIKSITSLSIGIISLIGTPLIGNDYSLKSRIVNGTGFFTGLFSLSYCLVINGKLRELEGKSKMLNELQKSLFIDEQMAIYNQFRQPILVPSQQPIIDISVPSNQPNELRTELPETLSINSSESSPNSELTELTQLLDISENTLLEVISALNNDIPDSRIIKEILKCKSERYQQGKAILETIKQSLQEGDRNE